MTILISFKLFWKLPEGRGGEGGARKRKEEEGEEERGGRGGGGEGGGREKRERKEGERRGRGGRGRGTKGYIKTNFQHFLWPNTLFSNNNALIMKKFESSMMWSSHATYDCYLLQFEQK